MARSNQVLVTTTPTFEDAEISAYAGVISSHVVAGANFFRDFFASFSDVFGGRSKSYQRELASINEEAIELLRDKAAALGANGIVGLSIDHDEVSGAGKSMFMVTAVGTAVSLKFKPNFASDREVVHGIDAFEMKLRVEKQRLIDMVRKRGAGAMVQDDWDFAIENGVSEISQEISSLAESRLDAHYDNPTGRNFRSVLTDYFASIDEDVAANALYELMASENRHVGFLAAELVQSLGLVKWDRIISLLRSEDIDDRRTTLLPLSDFKSSYSQADADDIEEVLFVLESAFPKAQVVEKEAGLLAKKQERWECVCGAQNKNDTWCSNCGRDRRGLIESDVQPDDVAVFLRRCIRELKA